MADETLQQREAKAIQLAEERGRRQQIVDGRLDEHDRRLAAINGSIDRAARAQEEMGRRLDGALAKMQAAEDISTALAKSARDAVTKQLSRREFWLGVLAIAAALLGPHFGGI